MFISKRKHEEQIKFLYDEYMSDLAKERLETVKTKAAKEEQLFFLKAAISGFIFDELNVKNVEIGEHTVTIIAPAELKELTINSSFKVDFE